MFFVNEYHHVDTVCHSQGNDKKNDHHSVNDEEVLPWAPLLAAYCEELYHVQYHEPAKVYFTSFSYLKNILFCTFSPFFGKSPAFFVTGRYSGQIFDFSSQKPETQSHIQDNQYDMLIAIIITMMIIKMSSMNMMIRLTKTCFIRDNCCLSAQLESLKYSSTFSSRLEIQRFKDLYFCSAHP